MPHGHCYLWQTPLVSLHVVSDFLIAIAYFSIPLMLLYFVSKRSDVPFQNIFLLFGAFIVLCGAGHLLEIWTLWHPAYWLSGTEQALTALVSCYTASEMATLLPKFLSLKTPEQLETVNKALQQEIQERQRAEVELRTLNDHLEILVQDRTAELKKSAEREQAFSRIIQRMRQTLDIETIFAATTEELRHVLDCDRTLVYQFNSDWSGTLVAESVDPVTPSIMALKATRLNAKTADISPPIGLKQILSQTYQYDFVLGDSSQEINCRTITDIKDVGFDPYTLKVLGKLKIKAYTVVPIVDGSHLWGLLMATKDIAPYTWDSAAIQIMTQVGIQLGVAVQQAELLAHSQTQSQALKVAKEEAEKASRTKSDFLSHMSHELRTPLNAILGYAQLMQRSQQLGVQDTQYINTINRSGNHLLTLINDVLEMSKIEAGQLHLRPVSFDLFNLLMELEEMFKLKASHKHITLTFHGQALVPRYIKADQNKLRQVLINLLGNAIKFTDNGQVTLNVFVQAQSLSFSVEDTGPGIDTDSFEQLFQAFEQGNAGVQSREGTGLGLSISRKFINLMGGHLTASSQVGEGSTFSFNIPLIIADELMVNSDIEPTDPPVSLAPAQTEFRILVVDDEPNNRIPLAEFLALTGFSVREATNGQSAIAVWEEWHPHLIWMDMQMPVMDGYQAAQQIKATTTGKSTIVIALTASVFEENKQKVLDAGCDDFVRKPFRQAEVLQKMAVHLGVEYLRLTNPPPHQSVPPHLSPQQESLSAESLKMMPSDWLKDIYQRASQGNDVLLNQLLEDIPPEHQSIAVALSHLIENYQFEKIIQLTEPLQGN